MKHYVWETMLNDGEVAEFVIFAKSRAQSAELQYHFWLHVDQIPKPWHAETWESFEIFGSKEELEKAYALNQEGLGIYVPDQGWSILPEGFADLPPK